MRASRTGEWVLVPAASGAEVVKALRRVGLRAELDGPDHVMMMRDGIQVVRVPLVDRVRPELLAAILKTAGMTPVQFIKSLDG